ncbi:hypothetical protein HBJ58_18375 [Halomonas desiderata]|uniref:hypothetical protein n=1 Tax=Billgrantia desiderata TaxID=52021 RepID=UPI0017483CD2|nr:hypothetical protein [Halomonas desiderata]
MPEEDEITALVMGPLAFLAPEAIAAFWMSIIERRRPESRFPGGHISFAKMHFWPKRGIEPDLFVELGWETGERRWILVEFKWRSTLSGEDQLHKQWLKFLSCHERENSFHVFIAPEISEGHRALGVEDVWRGKLLLYPWSDVLSTLRNFDSPESLLLAGWAEEVQALLGILNIRPFRGFKDMAFSQDCPFYPTAFWRAIDGFESLEPPASFIEGAALADNFNLDDE